ncbi:hypothetical protein, partial [Aquipseudomonas ullengensis]|uniref:hypothetical protein n=1 Tax=Aquipseudomonas ullengensis TaxID=2759166 RepID=UPI001C81A37B
RILQQPFFLSTSFEEFFVSSQPLALPICLRFTSAGGEFYSVKTRCQPPLFSFFSSFEPKHRQDQTATLPARRILLESATGATFIFV